MKTNKIIMLFIALNLLGCKEIHDSNHSETDENHFLFEEIYFLRFNLKG